MSQNSSKGFALVTGASSGLGREFAEILAKAGYNLILTARREELLKTMAQEISSKYSVTAKVFAADLSIESERQKLFDEISHSGLEIDVLINNAGFGLGGRFVELDVKKQKEMIRLNVEALTDIAHEIGKDMIKRKSGQILNVASMAAFMPGPNMAVYFATKAYVHSFSAALSYELRLAGVTVTALCPSATATGFADSAKMENSRMFSTAMPSAKEVAEFGYEALKRREIVAIYELKSKLSRFFIKFLPLDLQLYIVSKVTQNG